MAMSKTPREKLMSAMTKCLVMAGATEGELAKALPVISAVLQSGHCPTNVDSFLEDENMQERMNVTARRILDVVRGS